MNLKRLWSDHKKGIITTVVSGLLLSGITAGLKAVGWQGVKKAFIPILAVLSKQAHLPLWAVVIICLGCFTFIRVYRRLSQKKQEPAYCADVVKGIIWEWNAPFDSEPYPICPDCKGELRWKDVSAYVIVPVYILHCQNCGEVLRHNGEPLDCIETIQIELNRRIRTGIWKEATERLQAVDYNIKNYTR